MRILGTIFFGILLIMLLIPRWVWQLVFVCSLIYAIGIPMVLLGGSAILDLFDARAAKRRAREDASKQLRIAPRLTVLNELIKPKLLAKKTEINALLQSGELVIRDVQPIRCSNGHVYRYSNLEPYDDSEEDPTELLCPACGTSLFRFADDIVNNYSVCKHEHKIRSRDVGAILYAPGIRGCPICRQARLSIPCRNCGRMNKIGAKQAKQLVWNEQTMQCRQCGIELL